MLNWNPWNSIADQLFSSLLSSFLFIFIFIFFVLWCRVFFKRRGSSASVPGVAGLSGSLWRSTATRRETREMRRCLRHGAITKFGEIKECEKFRAAKECRVWCEAAAGNLGTWSKQIGAVCFVCLSREAFWTYFYQRSRVFARRSVGLVGCAVVPPLESHTMENTWLNTSFILELNLIS